VDDRSSLVYITLLAAEKAATSTCFLFRAQAGLKGMA